MISESFVINSLKKHLISKGWDVQTDLKKVNEHGVDLKAFHPSWRKSLYIEAKGQCGSEKSQHAIKHNAFYYLFGQILSRMDKEGNAPDKARIYALAIPKSWESTFIKKIKQMPYGWSLLKLQVFIVDNKGNVEKRHYSYFLKRERNMVNNTI